MPPSLLKLHPYQRTEADHTQQRSVQLLKHFFSTVVALALVALLIVLVVCCLRKKYRYI